MSRMDRKYMMTISLNVIDHLGLNLYSNIPAVLSEAVANAWDADATKVSIEIDTTQKIITITDDGMGMDLEDINAKFLTVGYLRREHEPVTTPMGRHVMGRKGIGKLSLFSIAKSIEVQTVKSRHSHDDRKDRNAFLMKSDEIRDAAKKQENYFPVPLQLDSLQIEKGTRLVLSKLSVRPTAATSSYLRRRLARRFSIIGERWDFVVVVDGQLVTVTDHDYYDKLQYLWSIGDVQERYERLAGNTERTSRLDGVVGSGVEVSGWVGTFDEQKSIEEGSNTVPVMAWGKLLHEDLLAAVRAGGLFTKYLTGEIHADFLDKDDDVDIVTSDRQHVKENDPRFEMLAQWFKTSVLNRIDAAWTNWRNESSMDRALAIEAVRDWHETLDPDGRRYAKQLFGKIGTLHLADDATRRELYKYVILAFEKLRFQKRLTAIDDLPEGADLSVIAAVFDGIDELEAVEYHQIAKGRAEVIRTFTNIVESEREAVIQRHLFDHLWLLHPSWERASTNRRIEELVTTEFGKIDARLSEDEAKGRIDIRYRTAAGKHIIIELKKYDVGVNAFDLAKQLSRYVSALRKVLETAFPDESRHIEAIAVLGRPPISGGLTEQQAEDALEAVGARYITYDSLIRDALQSYEQYLEADKRVSALNEILGRLENT